MLEGRCASSHGRSPAPGHRHWPGDRPRQRVTATGRARRRMRAAGLKVVEMSLPPTCARARSSARRSSTRGRPRSRALNARSVRPSCTCCAGSATSCRGSSTRSTRQAYGLTHASTRESTKPSRGARAGPAVQRVLDQSQHRRRGRRRAAVRRARLSGTGPKAGGPSTSAGWCAGCQRRGRSAVALPGPTEKRTRSSFIRAASSLHRRRRARALRRAKARSRPAIPCCCCAIPFDTRRKASAAADHVRRRARSCCDRRGAAGRGCNDARRVRGVFAAAPGRIAADRGTRCARQVRLDAPRHRAHVTVNTSAAAAMPRCCHWTKTRPSGGGRRVGQRSNRQFACVTSTPTPFARSSRGRGCSRRSTPCCSATIVAPLRTNHPIEVRASRRRRCC